MRKACAGDDQSAKSGEIHSRHIRFGQGKIGGVVAVDHRLAILDAGFHHSKRSARFALCQADMGAPDAVVIQLRQTKAAHGVVGHPRQQRGIRPLTRQCGGDIRGRSAKMGDKTLGRSDLGAGRVGVKVHPRTAKHDKAVARQALHHRPVLWPLRPASQLAWAAATRGLSETCGVPTSHQLWPCVVQPS